ncbi:TPA_asm: coat protein [ssRNA phage Zoerhiza.1_34]|uniref:Coat protein n=2 Tax=Leviviricetes TaxID=2842243 RepID=A0A8S5KXJ6_9VIRU|nr:coat protein [ssRNA phage Zoerhiza.1_34]QDH88814.1 MAG: hypothetical protein H1Rhizo27572_000002 [Leviviridae sp.]DAD49944.1 TPA_asm: coat protein [ssRNA phage Zoerhiza.1_34]
MAYSDPQTITVAGNAKTLARTGSGIGNGVFADSTGEYNLTVSHAYGKRNRRTVRVTTKGFSSDPLTPSNNVPVSGSFYVVSDFPVQGISVADQEALAAALCAWLTASTNANLKKLLGGEA